MLIYLKTILLYTIIYAIFLNISYANLAYKNDVDDNKNIFFKSNQDIKLKLQVEPADVKTFNKTVDLLKKNQWEDALSWADSIKSEHLKDAMVEYVLWRKYTNLPQSSAEYEFNNLLNFIQTHQYLPNINTLKRKAESMYLNNNIP